jgi:hypothetical protein
MAANRAGRDYSAKVAEAEAAVRAVKDPELRRVAFEKILTHLLGDDVEVQKAETAPRPSKARSTRGRSGGARDVRPRNAPSGPTARIVELAEDGFFKKQRTIADVRAELANRGHHIPLTSLSGPLQSLTQQRRLRRQKATGGDGGKATYAYSNW